MASTKPAQFTCVKNVVEFVSQDGSCFRNSAFNNCDSIFVQVPARIALSKANSYTLRRYCKVLRDEFT